MLTGRQRRAFFASLAGWSLDAFDFFIFVFCLRSISAEFHTDVKSVAEGIFLTLACRPLGALVFGWLAEKYGRRPILMLNRRQLLGGAACHRFRTQPRDPAALRALFGFAMGGEWGVGAALALETLPARGRGLFSGLLQEGYVIGYLLASLVFAYAFVHVGWRGMFIIGAAPALLVLYIRVGVEESPAWAAGVSPQRASAAASGCGEELLPDARLSGLLMACSMPSRMARRICIRPFCKRSTASPRRRPAHRHRHEPGRLGGPESASVRCPSAWAARRRQSCCRGARPCR